MKRVILNKVCVLRITPGDATLILELLDNPPKPNRGLRRAFARRKKLLGAGR
jgi:uncharacterized protein (DUF1778 family)